MSKRFPPVPSAFAQLALALAASSAGAQTALPDGPGKTLVEQKCAACHELGRVTRAGYDAAGWRNTVHMMANLGAPRAGLQRGQQGGAGDHPVGASPERRPA